LSSERALCMMSEEHGDIGCLMSCLLALTEDDEVVTLLEPPLLPLLSGVQ